jgi:MFS transporter, DHA2 family, multidrug resistance protein
VDAGLASAQAYRLLAAAVASQANVLAYQDGLIAAAIGAGVCLFLVALMRPGRPSPF